MAPTPWSLDDAVANTRTGDVWLFRGRSVPDRAIRVGTNSPVNHVGMTVAIDDLPPLMWHAELGRSLPDVWSGTRQRGVQLHDLRDAVVTWCNRYGQRAWVRQLDRPVTRPSEDALLRTIARLDGVPFPSTTRLFGRWLRGTARLPRLRKRDPEATPASVYCAQVIALTYQAMGLLPRGRPDFYHPGRFWSGRGLELLGGYHLGEEIAVEVPTSATVSRGRTGDEDSTG
jgi:hypothetical protein